MLSLLGIVVAIAAAFVPFSYQYFERQLEIDLSYRERVATALTAHAYLNGYRDRLGAGLQFLTEFMGDLKSWRGAFRGLIVCYVLAMGYSALFFIVSWILGGPLGIGQVELLPETPIGGRMLWILGLGMAALGLVKAYVLARDYSNDGSLVFAGIAALILSSIAWLAAGPSAGAIVISISFALVATSALLAGLVHDDTRSEESSSRPAITFMVRNGAAAIVIAGFLIVMGVDLDPSMFSFPLFLIVLPIANMALDWPSWWISRWLGQHLLHQTCNETKISSSSAVIAGHAIVDLVVAVVFLFMLVVVLAFIVAAYDLWSIAPAADPPLILDPIIGQAAQQPWPNAIWIVTMLLSTLVPTFLHAGVLIASPLALWLVPNDKRHAIKIGLLIHDNPNPDAIRYAAWYQVHFWVIAIVFPLALLAFFIAVINSLTDGVAAHLVWAAEIGIWFAHHLIVA